MRMAINAASENKSKPKGKSKRVNIELTEETHTKAKLIAVLTGTQLGKYFEKAIDEAVRKDKKLLEEAVKK